MESLIFELENILHTEHQLRKKGGYTENDLKIIQDKLRRIEALRIDGAFLRDENGVVPSGQARAHSLFHSCYRNIHMMLETCQIDDSLLNLLSKLEEIHYSLEFLKKHNGDKEQLRQIREELAEIEAYRREQASFLNDEGKVKPGQGYLHDIMNACFDLIAEMDGSKQEPEIDEGLIPLYHALLSLKEQILSKRNKGGYSLSDLNSLSEKLQAIEENCIDGKFYPKGHEKTMPVPKGQAVLSSLVHFCFRNLWQLYARVEIGDETEPLYEQLDSILCKLKGRSNSLDLREIEENMQKIEHDIKKHECNIFEVPQGHIVLHELLSSCYNELDALKRKMVSI